MIKKTLILAALLASSAAFADDAIVIKISSSVKENTPKGQALNKFKELAEKYTQGKVKVETGHDNVFMTQRDEVSFLRDNKVQMLVPSISKLDELYKKQDQNPFVALDVPYLFNDTNAFKKFADSDLAAEMGKTIDGSGAKVLTYWDNGFKMLSANRAINKPEDFNGMSFRVQASPVLYAQFKAWGANPRELNFGDMYTSAIYGSTDGAENPASNFTTTKMYEAQKYLYKTNHGYLAYVWLVNAKFWAGLPANVRDDVMRAVKDTTTFEREIAKRDNDFALQRAAGTGLTRVLEPTPAVSEFMHKNASKTEKVLSPVQKEYYAKIQALLK